MAAKCLRHAARRDAIASRLSDEGAPAADQSFPREARLVRRGSFDAVYRAGRRFSSTHFTVFVRANELAWSRFGFSIKKALGGAVVRNRIRRRLKAAVRDAAEMHANGQFDYVLIARRPALTSQFAALVGELVRALARVHRTPARRR